MKKLTLTSLLALLCSLSAFGQSDEPSKFQERSVSVSNVLYTIKYELKSTTSYSVPLTLPLGQPHYGCTASVWVGTNNVGKIETEWTKNGCFEDAPMMVIGRVLGWKRYPDNTAGNGLHWVCDGAAMYAESDSKQNKP